MRKSLINKIKRGIVLFTGIISIGASVNCKNVMNLPPEIVSTPQSIEVNEGEIYSYDVNAVDPDGDKINYSLPQAPPWLSIDSNTGLISGAAPEVSSDTYYPIKAMVSDGNDFETQSFNLKVKDTTSPDYVDISGNLQDNETDTGKQGLIKIYNATNNSYLGKCTANSSGNFSITLDKLVSELPDGVKLQAQLGNGTAESYIRTVELPQGDHSDVLMRCVPYPNFDTNNDTKINETDYDNFKQFMYDINGTFSKWDFNSFDKIKIFKHNNSEGDFNDTQTGLIVTAIKSSDDVEKFVEGRELDSYVQVIDGSPSEYWEENCIYVIPDNTPGGGGGDGITYIDRSASRIISKARIELNPTIVTGINPIKTHELGHAFIAPDGEAGSYSSPGPVSSDYTVMYTSGNVLSKPGIADEKAGDLIYEETYQHTDPYGMDDVLENVLGTDWLN